MSAWFVWLALVIAVCCFAVALPGPARFAIGACIAAVGCRGLRTFVLLKGRRAIRAIEWNEEGDLSVYLGATAAFGVLDPTTLLQGWWMKIIVVVGLFKAVQAALAYESEQKASAQSAAHSSPSPTPNDQLPEHLPLKF